MKKYILLLITGLLLWFTNFVNAWYNISTLPDDGFDPDRVEISYSEFWYYWFETLIKTWDFTFWWAWVGFNLYTCPVWFELYNDTIYWCNWWDISFDLNISNLIIYWSSAPGWLVMWDFWFLEEPAPAIELNNYSSILDTTALGWINEAWNIASSKIWIIALTFLGFSLFILILGLVYRAFKKK